MKSDPEATLSVSGAYRASQDILLPWIQSHADGDLRLGRRLCICLALPSAVLSAW